MRRVCMCVQRIIRAHTHTHLHIEADMTPLKQTRTHASVPLRETARASRETAISYTTAKKIISSHVITIARAVYEQIHV